MCNPMFVIQKNLPHIGQRAREAQTRAWSHMVEGRNRVLKVVFFHPDTSDVGAQHTHMHTHTHTEAHRATKEIKCN